MDLSLCLVRRQRLIPACALPDRGWNPPPWRVGARGDTATQRATRPGPVPSLPGGWSEQTHLPSVPEGHRGHRGVAARKEEAGNAALDVGHVGCGQRRTARRLPDQRPRWGLAGRLCCLEVNRRRPSTGKGSARPQRDSWELSKTVCLCSETKLFRHAAAAQHSGLAPDS